MTAIIPILAFAFAAFCVWLAVRIVNRKEQWAKWTLAISLSLPVLYVASFGPMCWFISRENISSPAVDTFYSPLASTMWWPGRWRAVGSILNSYAQWFAAPNWYWVRADPIDGERYYEWTDE